MTIFPSPPAPDAGGSNPNSAGRTGRRALVLGIGVLGAGAAAAIAIGSAGASASSSGAPTGYGVPGYGGSGYETNGSGPGAPGQGGHGGRGHGPGGMLDQSGTVTAVGNNSVTIQTSSGTTTYAVTADSDIDKNGEAQLSDLIAGDAVRFSATSDSGTPTIRILHAGDESKNMPAGPPPSAPPTA